MSLLSIKVVFLMATDDILKSSLYFYYKRPVISVVRDNLLKALYAFII